MGVDTVLKKNSTGPVEFITIPQKWPEIVLWNEKSHRLGLLWGSRFHPEKLWKIKQEFLWNIVEEVGCVELLLSGTLNNELLRSGKFL